MEGRHKARLIIGDSRSMAEVKDGEVDLIITSPPYWHLKDYGVKGQIGYGQTLHEYLTDLYMVWKECFRVLREGGRLCINIGDQFSRAVVYGRYKVIPIHAEIISQCESIGFDYLGSIIWQKKTTMNTTGGAVVMGSFPYPPNGIVEIDYEFILIFKKPGKNKIVPKEIKEASKLTKEEWKEYFSGHWRFAGAKKIGHEAMFPEELPKRLIKMFSFVGDTVLDPFLGSGTTMKVAMELNRKAIGYEINKEFLSLILSKIGDANQIDIIEREVDIVNKPPIEYLPRIKDAKPLIEPKSFNFNGERLYKVIRILNEETIETNTGLNIKFLGVKVIDRERTLKYLKDYILGKEIFIRNYQVLDEHTVKAYVYLKNKIFVNAYLLKSGLALPDLSENHLYKKKFIKLWQEVSSGERVDT
ncbi:MAG: site-specific DNA-methyltransferase [Aquificota bacterium]|jgi:DNA modification methylase|nr:site-specific DNA-methyltransferase [Aquificaceae bacterium]MDM7266765.1 site-specific DNA-methyltransferase [Aquificaceae bacterium]QWK13887.1 MAG: site-specific DNA-methyltransferase [Aquificota bacterium]